MYLPAKRTLVNALRNREPDPPVLITESSGVSPLPLDQALLALERAGNRDELLLSLLQGAVFWLREAQLFVVRGGLLRGHLALSSGRIDGTKIRGRTLDISASSTVERVLDRGRGLLTVVPEDDPIAHLVNHQQLVIQPVHLDSRPVCLLVGPPRDNRQGRREHLIWAVDQLAKGSADALHRVILELRRNSRRVPEQPREIVIVALPPPAPKAKKPARSAQIIPLPQRNRSAAPFRFPRRIDVSPTSLDNFYSGLDGSIHRGGVFVATHAPRRVGDQVEVTFTVPDLVGAQTITGSVEWVHEHHPDDERDGVTAGMGVKLTAAELSAGVRAAIERFLNQRQPILYG